MTTPSDKDRCEAAIIWGEPRWNGREWYRIGSSTGATLSEQPFALPESGTNNAGPETAGGESIAKPSGPEDVATSPAPISDTPRPARPVMSYGNLSGWSVYVTSLERYTDQLEQLYGSACLQLQARGDKTVAFSATQLTTDCRLTTDALKSGQVYDLIADAVTKIADAANAAFVKAGLEPGEWDGDDIVKDVSRGIANDIERLAARSATQERSK